jgi:hypothetical protein
MSRLLQLMEELAPKIGRVVESMLPPSTGFCLLLFDWGEKGNLTYLANCKRENMMRILREAADQIEKGLNKHPKAPS